jgi:hypothetical protein
MSTANPQKLSDLGALFDEHAIGASAIYSHSCDRLADGRRKPKDNVPKSVG